MQGVFDHIDGFFRYTRAYFLKNKNQIFEKIKEFKALAEKQFNQSMKCLRSYNGGEYVGQDFESCCRMVSLNIVLYFPQLSEMALQKKMIEMACCLIHVKSFFN